MTVKSLNRTAWQETLAERAWQLREDATELTKRGDVDPQVGHSLRQAALRMDEAVRLLGGPREAR